ERRSQRLCAVLLPASIARLKPLERPARRALQLPHVLTIQEKNDTFLAAGEHERRIGNQGHAAGAHVDVLKEQILVVVWRKPVDNLETGACQLQRAAAEIADTVIGTAGRGHIDIAQTVGRDSTPSLPDSTFPATRRRLEDGQPLLQIPRIECLQE